MTTATMADTMNKIALTAGVHNEEDFLEPWLRYHHFLGVERAYLYLDRCTDRSAEIAAGFHWVETIVLDDSWWRDVEFQTDLQNRHADDALQRARRAGVDWLLHIDPDEFVIPCAHMSPPPVLVGGALNRLALRAPQQAVQIRLATAESLMVDTGSAPFWHQEYFALSDPAAALDSARGVRPEQPPHFKGHADGKSLVRVSASVQSKNAHGWVADQGVRLPNRPNSRPLPTICGGWHLHYHVTSPEHWARKFPKQSRFPPYLRNNAPLDPFKREALEVCREISDPAELAARARGMFMPPDEAESLCRAGGNVLHYPAVGSWIRAHC